MGSGSVLKPPGSGVFLGSERPDKVLWHSSQRRPRPRCAAPQVWQCTGAPSRMIATAERIQPLTVRGRRAPPDAQRAAQPRRISRPFAVLGFCRPKASTRRHDETHACSTNAHGACHVGAGARVRHPGGCHGSDEIRPRPVYRGEGWIEAGDAQVGIQSARRYARPDAGSERLLDYEMRNSAKWEPLAPKDRARGRAWFRGLCASAETTCDMRSVDQ